jgi:hypothetical protein
VLDKLSPRNRDTPRTAKIVLLENITVKRDASVTLSDLKINIFESAYKTVMNRTFQDIFEKLGMGIFPLITRTRIPITIDTPNWKNIEKEIGSLFSSFRSIL